MADDENSLTGRLLRYANVGTGVGSAVARIAAGRLLGGERGTSAEGQLLAEALGNLKGPLMKVAQLLATIPDALPAAYAAELAQLQSQAPAMGWAFVKRRMAAELGPGADVLAEQVSGRDRRNAEPCGEESGLRSLAGSGRADQDDAHVPSLPPRSRCGSALATRRRCSAAPEPTP